jgi:signal transduction histidine kinase
MNAREQEGARVSRLLHDEVGQVLSAIGLQLDLLRMDLADDPKAAAARIGEIQRILEQAIGHVRDLSYELNPSVVERAGLQPALERLVARHRLEYVGKIHVEYQCAIRPPLEVSTAFYKIAEQALENAVRHSGAADIAIVVKGGRDRVALKVRDDGVGFWPSGARGKAPGLGIHLMRHYAADAHLRFSLASAPGKGTIVRAIHRVAEQAG